MTETEARLAYLKEYYPALWLAVGFQRNHKGEPLTFAGHQYMKGVYLDKAIYQVLMKSTQGGASEYLIATAIAKTLVQGRSVFYVLPTWGLQARFVKNRWDATIQATPLYKSAMKDMRAAGVDQSDSISFKKLGKGVTAFVGSQSTVGFTEFPADDVIIDELDECEASVLPMAEERLSHSKDPRQIRVGNPTYPGFGIAEEYNRTDRKHWMIKCPKCGKWFTPDFFQHVVREVGPGVFVLRDEEWDETVSRDVDMIHDCGAKVDRFQNGLWVAESPKLSPTLSGFHFNKLFSSRTSVSTTVKRFERGLTNDSVMQRFYNADLGLPFVAKGAKIDEEMLDACVEDYQMPDGCKEPCVAGVDVGSVLHVRVNRILPDGREQAVYIGTVRDESDLQDIIRRYNIVCGVIDSMPEIRLSRRVVQNRGWFKCSFHGGESRDHKDSINPETREASCGRTEILDGLKEKIVSKRMVLPRNARSLPDYYAQMQASVRTFDEKRKVYQWIEGSAADHFMFADAYAHLARRIMGSF